MIAREVIDRLARRGIHRRSNPFYQAVYDPRRVPELVEVRERIARYDRQLELRYNRASDMWELWRYKGGTRPTVTPDPEELLQRCVMLWEIDNPDHTFRPVDTRLIDYLVQGDLWESVSTDARFVADHMDREDRDREERESADLYDQVLDATAYHSPQMRRMDREIKVGWDPARVVSVAR